MGREGIFKLNHEDLLCSPHSDSHVYIQRLEGIRKMPSLFFFLFECAIFITELVHMYKKRHIFLLLTGEKNLK